MNLVSLVFDLGCICYFMVKEFTHLRVTTLKFKSHVNPIAL